MEDVSHSCEDDAQFNDYNKYTGMTVMCPKEVQLIYRFSTSEYGSYSRVTVKHSG
jgi:hypothetical protein